MNGVPEWLAIFWAAVLGGCMGSFLNVAAWRIPRGMSLLRPGSHCPACSTSIPPWRNIPVVSWLMQRGTCHACKIPIPVRYLAMEVCTGFVTALWMAAFLRGWMWEGDFVAALGWLFLFWALIPVALIDIQTFLVPNEIVVPALLIGLMLPMVGPGPDGPAVLRTLIGTLLAGGFWYGFSWLSGVALRMFGAFARAMIRARMARRVGRMLGSRKVHRGLASWMRRTGRFDASTEALGLGDVNIMMAAAALVGPVPAVVAILPAAVVGLAAIPLTRGLPRPADVDPSALPFGPSLGVGVLLVQPFLCAWEGIEYLAPLLQHTA